MNGVKYPFAKATSLTLAPLATGAAAATIDDTMTFINLGTFSAATTLTLTASSEIMVGARVLVQGLVDGTNRVLSFAGDALAAATTFTASKTRTVELIWNGSKFVGVGTMQID